ncbi:MAG: H-NS histone family protein [Rhodoferax sp.]|nr:H-NS histone family protein [Rhodoferax sp.]
MELDGLPQAVKRGPGRPRDPYALTNAERQQRWRDKQKRLKRPGMPAAKYQCPLTGKTWTGRGLMPKWLSMAVAEGNPLWMYLVNR